MGFFSAFAFIFIPPFQHWVLSIVSEIHCIVEEHITKIEVCHMTDDPVLKKALFRYQIISPLLAMDIPRGRRTALYRELAEKEWVSPSGELVKISTETIRYWLRQYKKEGFEGLKDAQRSLRDGKLPEEVIIKACQLKQEVTERSLDKIIKIMEDMGFVGEGLLTRSTLHRHLQQRGLSARRLKLADRRDLARWQADYANDLWQSDMLAGPYLPDPEDPGKKRKAWLYAFIDDASRLVLYGRFFFKGDLPALELVFKHAIARCGSPLAVYYDNGQVYRALHMKTICAELGIRPPIFTHEGRPEGHGKIEAWNSFCTSDFLAELKDSYVTTLEQLNEIFVIWVEYEYNRRQHSELGCTPRERWMQDASRFRYATEEKLREIFLWREERHVDKCAMIQLFTRKYRVSPQFSKRKVEVRYNPEHLEVVEIWVNGKFQERVRPYVPQRHRPPKAALPPSPVPPSTEKVDYLSFLKGKYTGCPGDRHPEKENPAIPSDEQLLSAFMAIFKDRIAPEVYDEREIRDHWKRYGPFDLTETSLALDALLEDHPRDLHISFYLQYISRGGNGL